MARHAGFRHSEETKRRISNSMKARKHRCSNETREKIRASMRLHWAKIYDKEKKSIFELYDERGLPVASIASMYNISVKHLYHLIRERNKAEFSDREGLGE